MPSSAHDGNASQALEDVRGIFALSDALRGEPCLISQLVRIAIHAVGRDTALRLMPHCRWSDAELETLQTSFQSARFNEEMAHAMCGERAALLRALDDMPLGPLRQSNARMALRLCADSIEGFSGSWQDALVRQREVGGEIRSLAKDAFSRLRFTGVILIFPATSMAAVAGAQAEARQKSANAAIAVWRFRLQHDRWPDSLDEINGMELGETTERTRKLTDPFDGNPLRYKVEERRILIYSVGDNEVDDGGALYRKGQKQPLDAGVSFKR